MPRFGKGRQSNGQQAPYHVRKTTLLPASLREELVASGRLEGQQGGNGSDNTGVLGRKQRRKDDRNARKSSGQGSIPKTKPVKPSSNLKSVIHSKQKSSISTNADPSSSKQRKRARFQDDVDANVDDGPRASTSKPVNEKTKPPQDNRTTLQRMVDKQDATGYGKHPQSSSSKLTKPKGYRSAVEKDEDSEIAWLEAKLGVRRTGAGRKQLEEDGLDDLFDDLDRLDEELFAGDDEQETVSGSSDDEGDSDMSSDSHGQPEADSDQIVSEVDDIAELDSESGEEGTILTAETQEAIASNPSDGKVDAALLEKQKYIPPALRKQSEPSATSLPAEVDDPQLRRQLRGLLNRLSATSFPALVLNPLDPSSLHSIYLSKSRAVVSRILVRLICEIISAQGEAGGIGDTQVVVMAGLVKLLSTGIVGGMSSNGGKEIAASVVDSVVKQLDDVAASDIDTHKQRTNLVGFLAVLYNLQVIAAGLMYDLIREAIARGLSEEDAEVLLRILRVSGAQLRHDDPNALKAIISLVNEQQKGIAPDSLTSRQRFMLETLTNLRNNKLKQPTGVTADTEASLKKYIGGLARKSSVSTEPLRLTLDDLRQSGEKGKWWLVGAAWSGDPLVDRHSDIAVGSGAYKSGKEDESKGKEAALLKLARKQGMNTDIRRNVFVAVMGAQDYMDACERIMQLKLTEVQQREVVRVLLHCLGREKAYNPFYTLIMARLPTSSPTGLSHSYQITLQYALWDLFREMGEKDVGGSDMARNTSHGTVDEKRSRNLAKAYAWWIAKAGLGLTVLKPLTFQLLTRDTRTFLSILFSSLILSTQTDSPLLISVRSASNRDSKSLVTPFLALAAANGGVAQGVYWFLENDKDLRRSTDEIVKWGIQSAMQALSTSVSFIV